MIEKKKIEKINVTIALKKIYPADVSKNISNRVKQVILLKILNKKRQEAKIHGWWYYHTVKKLSALVRQMTSKHRIDFYCLNCLHYSAIEKDLNCIKRHVKIKILVTL